jgi:hypothetical protein
MKKLALILSIFSLVACKKEDANPITTTNNPTSDFAFVTSEQGSSFVVFLPDGSSQTLSGQTILGWDGGALLNGSFYRLLRIQVGSTYCYLRFSFPQGTDWENEVQQERSLLEFPFELQESANMSDVVAEWYAPSSNEWLGNASGTVHVLLNQDISGETYDVVGSVEATFYSSLGNSYILNGHFWKKTI